MIPLRCRLGFHPTAKVAAWRHAFIGGGLRGPARPGTVWTWRCRQCGRRWRRISYAELHYLDETRKP
jgi:hypothetical protein